MSLMLTPLPTVDAETCGVGSASIGGCRACVDHCPYGAIDVRTRPEGSEITIDPLACQRCGACSGVCPTSSITRPFLPDDELIGSLVAAAGAEDGPVIAITCPDSEQRVSAALGEDHVVVSPSLLIVNETHLVTPIVAGARGILLVGCPRCTHDQPMKLREPLSVARVMLDEPRRVAYVEDDRTDRFEAALITAAELNAPGYAFGVEAISALEHATTRRERLAELLRACGDGGMTPMGATGFGQIQLDQDACVACGACSVVCPTDALELDPTAASLEVTDLDCIACGACVSACPDDALSLLPAVPVGSGALQRRTLLTDDSVACRVCGEHYAAQRLLAHARTTLEEAHLDPDDPRFQLGVCPDCRRSDARKVGLDDLKDGSDGCDGGCECDCASTVNGQGDADPPIGHSPPDAALLLDEPAGPTDPSRRAFLKGAAATVAAGAALPLFSGSMQPAIAMEQEPVIRAGRLGMVIDLERCIGCHACTNACKAENNVPLGGFRDWVEEHVIGEYPDAEPYFVPKLCNHCEDPGCLKACPTGAIYKREDGIVELDSSICLACQACMQGCPYGMTFYNSARNTADKCNYCAHRVDDGLRPACVEVCPSQCRIFGDLDDPDSAPSRYIAEHETQVMRPEIGFGPNTHYVGLPGELNR